MTFTCLYAIEVAGRQLERLLDGKGEGKKTPRGAEYQGTKHFLKKKRQKKTTAVIRQKLFWMEPLLFPIRPPVGVVFSGLICCRCCLQTHSFRFTYLADALFFDEAIHQFKLGVLSHRGVTSESALHVSASTVQGA